ncbi:MAG: BadF/BadG/BcrA/BcrD ATPase family protein [Lacisediminihabitans sp.]
MQKILAIDAGGTSSRAVVLDLSGRCLAFGRAGSGNPTARGIDSAVDQLAAVASLVSGRDPSPTGYGSSAVIALAGMPSAAFRERLSERIAPLGFDGGVSLEPDLLGVYYSGTIAQEGSALIAGTGAVAGRIRQGRLEFTRGGTGWLLGDSGAGFWIGRRIARAVVAALDHLGPDTALTEAVLTLFDIRSEPGQSRGRPQTLVRLMDKIYELRPVELARLAPLAFGALDDPIARDILVEAAGELGALLETTRGDDARGPIVLGGGILSAGMKLAPSIFAEKLEVAADGAELIVVPDGVVGAAVIGLMRAGVSVDEEIFLRIQNGVELLRTADFSAGTA